MEEKCCTQKTLKWGKCTKSRTFGGIHKPLLSYEENEDSKKD